MLCAIAADADCEPGPGREGKPFAISIGRLSKETNQPPSLTVARLLDLIRMGLIDDTQIPPNGAEQFTVRIATVDAGSEEEAK